MDAKNFIDDPIGLLRSLSAEALKERLAQAEAEADALRVLLRSARARDRHLRPMPATSQPKAVMA